MSTAGTNAAWVLTVLDQIDASGVVPRDFYGNLQINFQGGKVSNAAATESVLPSSRKPAEKARHQ